ncbi:biotin-dependent carboxyltransferase family protein [Robbsia sp. KACC 23696]|uniref:5-oxoprolinase subunit C family protein n=1 Tax=Robbsia sp. KACC 23696 TaxID=3149231 RepID=UPI00325AE6EF
MIEILSNVALATVQDLGRSGYLAVGVGHSGAMDRIALRVANIMLGNDEDAAAIEIPLFPFRVRFDADIDFVVSGAAGPTQLDGARVLPTWVTHARAGQTLTIGHPLHGARSYLQVTGGIDVPVVLGSRSTQMRGAFGGFEGRALRKGDVLPFAPATTLRAQGERTPSPVPFGILDPSLAITAAMPPASGTAAGAPIIPLRVLPGAEYDLYTSASLADFWDKGWRVTPQSDRYGYRLDGPGLVARATLEKRSHGIVPGVIQVPHSGQPIIQLSDAQPSGGYPKIGTVIEADLWRLAQAPIGSTLRFVKTDYAEAVAAEAGVDAYLAQVRHAASLMRGAV